MEQLRSAHDVQQWLRQGRASLPRRSHSLVPTMGNLHEGHLSLIELAKTQADLCLVSVFVNPTQFGPQEDFERYPRTLESDLALLEQAAVDAVFLPDITTLYPAPEHKQILLSCPTLQTTLCGHYRPEHFGGVLQVVNKLLNLCQPQTAVFGEKDFQQLLLIKRMVTDFLMPISIIGAPIIREPSGLAISSRNQYLSQQHHAIAPQLQAHLQQTTQAIRTGALSTIAELAQHLQHQKQALDALGFNMQYYQTCFTDDLSALNSLPPQTPLNQIRSQSPLITLAAGYLGQTRLIDNHIMR